MRRRARGREMKEENGTSKGDNLSDLRVDFSELFEKQQALYIIRDMN